MAVAGWGRWVVVQGNLQVNSAQAEENWVGARPPLSLTGFVGEGQLVQDCSLNNYDGS